MKWLIGDKYHPCTQKKKGQEKITKTSGKGLIGDATQKYLSKGHYRTSYLRIRRGSGLNAGGTAIIGAGPPI